MYQPITKPVGLLFYLEYLKDKKSKCERLVGDSEQPYSCTVCGSEIIHNSSNEDYDYYVYCSNDNCVNMIGKDCFDLDCPEWAHGPRFKKCI